MSATTTERFTATNGRVIGWVAVALMGLGIVATLADGSHDSDLVVAAGLLLAAAGLWVFLLQPHVRVSGTELELHNPLRVVTIPLAAVEGIEVRLSLHVWAHGRRYTCAAISRTRKAMAHPAAPDPRNNPVDLLEETVRVRAEQAQALGLEAGPVRLRFVPELVAVVVVPAVLVVVAALAS